VIRIAMRFEVRDLRIEALDHARRARNFRRAAEATPAWRSLMTQASQSECEYYATEYETRSEFARLAAAREAGR